MNTRNQRAKRNKMNRSIATRLNDLEWLNEQMTIHGLITENCQNLQDAYFVLSPLYFCIYQFAKGKFKQFNSYHQLQAYINGAEHPNGFNPLKYPLNMAKDNGFSCFLIKTR